MEIMTNVNLCTEDKALEKLLPEYQYDKKLFIEYTKVFWTFPLLVNTFIKNKYLSNIFHTRHQKDAHLNIPCGCSTSALLTALTAIFTFIEYQFVFSNHFPCFLVYKAKGP